MTSDTDELTCQELVELVTDYLEGAMAAKDRALFEQHLAICDGCVNYLEQMRTTVAIVGALSEESLPEPLKSKLLNAFSGWKKSRS
jgi:anti-sigma factor RsiW